MADLNLNGHIILASTSPRRCELLQQLGLQFQILAPDIDESVEMGESAARYVERLARQKALTIQLTHPTKVIVAADTTVCVDGEIIGKAEHQQQAFAIWQKLSARKHQVLTGVCVLYKDLILTDVVTTDVEFCHLSQQDMQDYWATGEPMGKAGAYAIQGIASQFIPSICGSYSNVVGLPLYETMQLLKKIKIQANIE